MATFHQCDIQVDKEVLPFLYKAIALDPSFAAAYCMAARCYSRCKSGGWVTYRCGEIAETKRLTRPAGELGRDDVVALYSAGILLAFLVGDVGGGAALIKRALVQNPNLAGVWLMSGWAKL